MVLIERLKVLPKQVLPDLPPDDLPAVPLDWLGPYSMLAAPSSQPIPTEVQVEAGTTTVRFDPEVDRTYQLESTSSLGPDAFWHSVGVTVTGTGAPQTVTGVPITERQTFFRVRAE